jgi:hypothetical protein
MSEYVRATEQPVSVTIRMVDGLYIKQTVFPQAGMIAPQHSHEAAHLSGIASGAVEVERDGVSLGYFEAPALIPINARVKHLFRTLRPNTTVWCIFATADFEGDEPATHEEHVLPFVGEI